MSSHKQMNFRSKETGLHYAVCNPCGHRTKQVATEQLVEDEWFKHLAFVERVRTHLGTHSPTLKQQRDYYADMAKNDPSAKDRELWQQLADELSVRLGDKAPKWEQPELMDF